MAYLPDELINEIHDQTDIVDVASQYVQLAKKGRNYLASCPFHQDQSPSFTVSQEKQIYKCFSCGRGGNVFGLVSEMEGISFPEAVIKVAQMNNIPIDNRYISSTEKKNQAHKPLLDIHQKASEFYQYYLMSTTNAQDKLDYLLRRGLGEETLKEFKIGMAPAKSDLLHQYLAKEGFRDEQLIESGIFYLSDEGDMVDRFRNRIVFPLADQRGAIRGFSGRTLDPNQSAKYLNSPDTPIFNKSRLLYNLDQARHNIRQNNQVLLLEGFMDVISLWQAGVKNAVATMGTALTREHMDQLIKLTDEIIFVFDGDSAGQEATKKAFELGLNYPEENFKSVTIPDKMDPDEWVKSRGSDSFFQLLANADSYYEFMRGYLKNQYDLSNSSQLASYIDDLTQEVAKINSPIERQLRIQELVAEYDFSEDIINEQVTRYRYDQKQKAQLHQSTSKHKSKQDTYYERESYSKKSDLFTNQIKSNRAFNSEKQILYQLLHHKEAWDYVADLPEFVFFHELCQKAYFTMEEFYYDKGYSLPMTGVIDKIEDTHVNNLITSLLMESDDIEFSKKLMDDCFVVIDEEFIKLEIEELKVNAKQFRLENKDRQLRETMNEIIKLTRSIK